MIIIPNDLPAHKTLTEENIFVMTQRRADTQQIRPLKILLLNLMPTKIETETQFARLLGNTPIHVELDLMQMKSHVSKNISAEHMLKFYDTFDEVKYRYYDGFVITGQKHMFILPFTFAGERRQDYIITMESIRFLWRKSCLAYSLMK